MQITGHEQFCKDTDVEKKRTVEEIYEQIKALKSDVEKYTTTAAELTKEIAEREKNTSLWIDYAKPTTEVRGHKKNEWYDWQREDQSHHHKNWGEYKWRESNDYVYGGPRMFLF